MHQLIETIEVIKKPIKSCDQINYGWSRDLKYIICDKHQQKFLLRVSNDLRQTNKQTQFDALSQINALSINVPKAYAYGVYENYQYLVLEYIEGEELSDVLPFMTKQKQYKLGLKAGQMMHQIHQIKIEQPERSWYDFFLKKLQLKIDKLEEMKITLPNQASMISHIRKYQHLLANQTYALCHGDYHVGNMIYQDNDVYLIDFDKVSFTDYHDEFKPFVWNVYKSTYFQTGLIDGYFKNKIPSDFFKILSVYAVESLLGQLPWAISFGAKEVEIANQLIKDVSSWFKDFTEVVPTFYIEHAKYMLADEDFVSYQDRFFQSGKLVVWPKKVKAKHAVAQIILKDFLYEKVYLELEVNKIIGDVYDDFATIRRFLIDYKYLERDLYGKTYRRV